MSQEQEQEEKPRRVYQKGDVVWVRGKITEVDEDTPEEMYLVQTGLNDDGGYVDESWYGQATVTTFEVGEEGIEPGDFVRFRRTPSGHVQLGQVIALKKGRAWIDWAPFNEDLDASGAAAVNLLTKASVEEVQIAREEMSA